MAVKTLLSLDVAASWSSMDDTLSECSGTGMIIRIACLKIVRRAHELARSMKTQIPSTQSPNPETKQCSALSLSAVSRNASR